MRTSSKEFAPTQSSAARGALALLGPLALCASLAACSEGGRPAPTGDGGQVSADGGPIADGGGGSDGGVVGRDGGAGQDGGSTGDGGIDPNNPNNPFTDSDCDGLSDAEELSTIYAGGRKTDPLNPDTDGDGIPDGVEVGRTQSPDPNCANFVGDADPTTRTDPTNPDTDGDGLPDGVEDANHNGKVDPGETDPRNRDTDHDGVPDGMDQCPLVPGPASNNGCPVDGGVIFSDGGTFVDSDGDGLSDDDEVNIYGTDPHNPDTDGDGLTDGEEVLVYHTNPLRKDTDCDGLTDFQEVHPAPGFPVTDPLNPDTDGDGLPDGLEEGVTVNPDPVNCPNVKLDMCPQTTTDPTKADTDGDGLLDGVEDANQNGCVDPGETDPNNPADGADAGVITAACSLSALRPVVFKSEAQDNIQTATVPSFAAVQDLTVNGMKVGALYYDATNAVVAFALSKTPAGADILAEETSGRAAFNQVGAITLPTTQTITAWDGLPARLALYDWAGAGDLKTKINGAVANLLGNPAGLAGTFTDTAGIAGPHKLRVEYVRRSDTQAVVIGASVATAAFDAQHDIRVSDVANGTALGDSYDSSSVQCDTFTSGSAPKVDFLWVIDNSGSMGDDQTSLSAGAQAMADQLASANIDYRLATAYTDSDRPSTRGTCSGAPGPGKGVVCPFTSDINLFKNGSAQCAYSKPGTCGSGTERAFAGALKAIQDFQAGTGCETVTGATCSVRPDAQLVIIFVTDTGEQTTTTPPGQPDGSEQSWVNYFKGLSFGDGGATGVLANGVLCPSRMNVPTDGGLDGPCTDNLTNLALYDRLSQFISDMGGVEGSIHSTAMQWSDTIHSIVNAVLGVVSRYQLTKPPISATLKVALQRPTGPTEIPRDPVNGYDYNGPANSITLFGTSLPDMAGRQVAVSYRYWVNGVAPPMSMCPPCTAPRVCNQQAGQCVCPPDCGTPSPGAAYFCDPVSCTWKCTFDCGGACTQYQMCNTDTCGCVCQQNVTCAPGFRFSNSMCDCICDTEALSCNQQRYTIDPVACTCVCKPDCGGCSASSPCNTSLCRCVPR
jgi:hypothetical protein